MGTSVVVAYVWALVICIVALLVAAVIAYMIPNKPGGKDISQRRVWYWVLFVVAIAVSLCINMILASKISIPSKHDAYMVAAAISAVVCAVVYVLIGLCLSKGMKRSKLGSWF